MLPSTVLIQVRSNVDGSSVRAAGKSLGGETPSANSHEPTTKTQRNCRGNESHGLDFGKRRGVIRRRVTNTPTAKGRYPSREATTVIEVAARTKPLTVWNNSYRNPSQTINGDAGGPSQRVMAAVCLQNLMFRYRLEGDKRG